jgi:hypothetical protein
VDYFVGVDSFLRYVANQGILLGDVELASSIESLMTSTSSAVVSMSSEREPSKSDSPQKKQRQAISSVDTNKENVDNKPSSKPPKKKISSALDSSDEDDEEPKTANKSQSFRRPQGMDSLLTVATADPDVAKNIQLDAMLKPQQEKISQSSANPAEDGGKHVSFSGPVFSQDNTNALHDTNVNPNIWACPMCTFHNDIVERLSCRACG